MLSPPLGLSTQERPVGVGPEQIHKSNQRAGALFSEDRLRKLWVFSLKQRRLWRVLIVAFQYLLILLIRLIPYQKEKHQPVSRACCDGTRGNGLKLKEGRLILDIRKRFFTMRMVEQCSMLSEEVVDAPSLKTFKAQSDRALSS